MTSVSPPSYSDRQLRTLEVLRRNDQAWWAFWFVLSAFTLVLALLAYTIIWNKTGEAVKFAIATVDGIIGWSLKHVISHLFPGASPPTKPAG